MLGNCEIRGMVKCASLLKQVYLCCIFKQLITVGSSFIRHLYCLPSACNFALLLFSQLIGFFMSPFLFFFFFSVLFSHKLDSTGLHILVFTPHRLKSTSASSGREWWCLHEEALFPQGKLTRLTRHEMTPVLE